MLEKVLAVGRTVLHPSDEFDQFDVHSVDAKVDAGALSCLQNLFLKLLLHLGDDLLDPCRMDPAVDHKLVERQSGYLPANRVECREKDGIRSVVDHDLDTCRSLQSPDVAAFASDYPTLDLIVLDREGSDRILDSCFGGRPLDGVDHDSLGFLGSIEPGLVHGVVDVGLGFGTGFRLHVLHQDVLGILSAHPGNHLELLVDLGGLLFIFILLLCEILLLGDE